MQRGIGVSPVRIRVMLWPEAACPGRVSGHFGVPATGPRRRRSRSLSRCTSGNIGVSAGDSRRVRNGAADEQDVPVFVAHSRERRDRFQ